MHGACARVLALILPLIFRNVLNDGGNWLLECWVFCIGIQKL